jgi:hypothetical protein
MSDFRKNQRYFILRRGNPWSVRDIEGRYICDYPAYHYNDKLTDKICHAKSDEEVKQLLSGEVNVADDV